MHEVNLEQDVNFRILKQKNFRSERNPLSELECEKMNKVMSSLRTDSERDSKVAIRKVILLSDSESCPVPPDLIALKFDWDDLLQTWEDLHFDWNAVTDVIVSEALDSARVRPNPSDPQIFISLPYIDFDGKVLISKL